MRANDTAIRELPITQRTAPQTGPAASKAAAKDKNGIAVATGANSFFIVSSTDVGDEVQIGARLSLRFSQGRASVDKNRGRERKIRYCADDAQRLKSNGSGDNEPRDAKSLRDAKGRIVALKIGEPWGAVT